MNILTLTKFPPTQGGEASKAYWLARGLGNQGHTVHVVTNALETDKAFLVKDATDPSKHLPANVHIHFIEREVEFHVPFHLAFAERLASKALDVIEHHQIDVIESAHLTPFGVSALIVKACTGLPLVHRHGGSDVGYLWKSAAFSNLITKVIQAADRMVINVELASEFLEAGVPAERLDTFRYFVDQTLFSDDGSLDPRIPNEIPVFLFSGKITPGKKLIPLLEALQDIDLPFKLLLLPVAFKTEMVRELLELYDLKEKAIVLDPRPCWEMPALLRSVTAVCCLETRFTTSNHWPLFPREVLLSGTCLILSKEQYERKAMREAEDGKHLLMVDPDDPEHMRDVLTRVISQPTLPEKIGRAGAELARRSEDYGLMINDLENIYGRAIEYCHANQ